MYCYQCNVIITVFCVSHFPETVGIPEIFPMATKFVKNKNLFSVESSRTRLDFSWAVKEKKNPLSPKGAYICFFFFLQVTITTIPLVVKKHFLVAKIAKIRNSPRI